MMFAIPESPRWLITAKNNIEAAKQVFRSLYDNEGDIVEQVNLIVNSQKSTDDAESIFSKKYGIPLSLAFFIAFFNQLPSQDMQNIIIDNNIERLKRTINTHKDKISPVIKKVIIFSSNVSEMKQLNLDEFQQYDQQTTCLDIEDDIDAFI